MNDRSVVANTGIRSAIIVDDGYDEIPLVAELVDEESWDSFFDDARGDDAVRISAFFPEYNPDEREALKSSQRFIDALWRGRDAIRDLLNGLFDAYEEKAEENAPFLQAAEAALRALGIPYETLGRDFVQGAERSDLILIDLFMGSQQGLPDREFTVERLRNAIVRRPNDLPSIVLMSRVPGIDELSREFRKDANLHASAFRHIDKANLLISGRVEALILTLAAHRADSQALATFVDTWQTKALESVCVAAGNLRRIDIDDLQHIRSMLLRFEGLNTSSYMLDVFDRVLQYEIEANPEVVDAAKPLDAMSEDAAPLLISNDRDTYAVLERTLFVNPTRLLHSTGAVWPIAFGDIVGPRPGSTLKRNGLFSGRNDLVFFVASPECDLIREDGLKTALLVAGTLEQVDISKPVLGVSGNTTPVLNLGNNGRYQVTWDFGDLRTIRLRRARQLLKANGDAVVCGRLRNVSALDLRQQLLRNIGRVGQIAPLPRSFRFGVEIYYVSADNGVRQLALPPRVQIRGNMLVPRRGRHGNLIFDSICEEELTTALMNLDLDNVSRRSRDRVGMLKELARIRKLFRSGFQWVELPLAGSRSAELLKEGEILPEKDDKKPKVEKVGMIVTDENFAEELGQELSRAGLLFLIHVDDAPV